MVGELEQHGISYLSAELFLNRKSVTHLLLQTVRKVLIGITPEVHTLIFSSISSIVCKNAYNVASFHILLLKAK
jgi:hypothetical protein